MKAKAAASELEAIRNDRSEDKSDLIKRVDKIGSWAATQKYSKLIGKILTECHELNARLS